MDLYTCVYYTTLFFAPIISYLILFKGKQSRNGVYSSPDWFYPIKYYFAKKAAKRKQQSREDDFLQETPQKLKTDQEHEYHKLYASDQKGNRFALNFVLRKHRLAETSIYLKLNDGTTYHTPETTLVRIPRREFKANGFEIKILEPFKRLRITYNGLLLSKKGAEHVRLHLRWCYAGRPLFYRRDASVELLADALAKHRWRDGNWVDLLPEDDYYEQFGALNGTITRGTDVVELNMASYRKHYRGLSDVYRVRRGFSCFGAAEDGTVFSLGANNYADGCSHFRYGNLILNNGEVRPLSNHDGNLVEIGNDGVLPEVFVVHFKGGNNTFKCVAHLNISEACNVRCSEEQGWELVRVPAEYDLNAQQAKGFVEFWYQKRGPGKEIPPPILTDPNEKTCLVHFVRPLNDDYCKNLRFTGGKANSLSLLTSVKSDEFRVPPGFVVLIAAFQQQIEDRPEVSAAISHLEKVARGLISEDLKTVSEKTTELISRTEITEQVKKPLLLELNKFDEHQSWRWAVRSSASGEDSEDASYAGQNSTFLGCATAEEVLEAVAKCWASVYSYSSVEYRRQNGSDVRNDIAVVVQKMVDADCAGVLFTCEPLEGNPDCLVISSNYGLGESVVSGLSDPDSIVLKRDTRGNITSCTTQIGNKAQIVTLSGSSGTEVMNVPSEKSSSLSLSEERSFRLGRVGIALEKAFGCRLDVEWAYEKEELFILQARPVTTLNAWTFYEIAHELDSSVLSEEDTFLTKANVGEVMPGAVTALTRTTVLPIISEAMEKVAGNFLPYTKRGFRVHQHQAFIEYTNMMKQIYGEDNMMNKATDLSVFGHFVRNEEMASVVLRRYGPVSKLQKLKNLCHTIRDAWNAESRLERAIATNENVDIRIEINDDAVEAYEKIKKYLGTVYEMSEHHMIASEASVFYQFVAMNILLQGKAEFTTDHYHDISLLFFSGDNVISAEIPKSLRLLAKTIADEGLTDDFLAVPIENCTEWLRERSPKFHHDFTAFLEEHGHRAIREFELNVPSWKQNPAELLQIIKSNLKTKQGERKERTWSLDETINELLTPTSSVERYLLKLLIKKSKTAVARRERTKCELSRSINKLRSAYRILALKMTQEGKLPRTDLIFHLTDYEISQIISGNEPTLVRKAAMRSRSFHKFDQLRFPEISHGIPVPESRTVYERKGSVRLKGTPVCMGEVIGRACVVLTSQEAAEELKNGDILITRSTDIAWSLYFPMLGGVVTELGGLISHGAVIAREYCLPCVVGVRDATNMFKTGDAVRLSGIEGVLELVEAQET